MSTSDDDDVSAGPVFAPEKQSKKLACVEDVATSLGGLRLELLFRIDLRDQNLGDGSDTWQWDWLAQCGSLRELNINSNRLSVVPPVLAELTRLRLLSCSYNRDLRVVPHYLGRLRKLTYIAFSHCPIGHVAKSLSALSKVASLWLGTAYACGPEALTLLRNAITESSGRLSDAVRTCCCLLWCRRTIAFGGPVPREIVRKIGEMVLDDAVLATSAKPLMFGKKRGGSEPEETTEVV